MKTLLVNLLLLMSSVSLATNDLSANNVPTQSYVLLGRGIHKKGTHENLALACRNKSCTRYQFLYFDETGKHEWLGPRFRMPVAENEKQLQSAIQLQLEYFFAAYAPKEFVKKGDRVLGLTGQLSLWAGTPTILAVVGATSFVSLVAFAPAALFMAVVSIAKPRSIENMIAQAGEFVTLSSVDDTEGWNWSSNPTEVKEVKFDHVMAVLNHYADGWLIFPDHEARHRFDKRYDRLVKKGAVFEMQLRHPRWEKEQLEKELLEHPEEIIQ